MQLVTKRNATYSYKTQCSSCARLKTRVQIDSLSISDKRDVSDCHVLKGKLSFFPARLVFLTLAPSLYSFSRADLNDHRCIFSQRDATTVTVRELRDEWAAHGIQINFIRSYLRSR